MYPLFGSLDESSGMSGAHDCSFAKYPDIIVLRKIKGGKREKSESGYLISSRFLESVPPLLRGDYRRGHPAETRKRGMAVTYTKVAITNNIAAQFPNGGPFSIN